MQWSDPGSGAQQPGDGGLGTLLPQRSVRGTQMSDQKLRRIHPHSGGQLARQTAVHARVEVARTLLPLLVVGHPDRVLRPRARVPRVADASPPVLHVVVSELEDSNPVGAQPGALDGVIGQPVLVLRSGVKLVPVEVERDPRTGCIRAFEEDVGAGAVENPLLGDPPADGGPVSAGQAQVQRVRSGRGRVGVRARLGRGLLGPFAQGLQEHDLQIALGLAFQRDLVGVRHR